MRQFGFFGRGIMDNDFALSQQTRAFLAYTHSKIPRYRPPNCSMQFLESLQLCAVHTTDLPCIAHRRRTNECPWRETAHILKIVITPIMHIFAWPQNALHSTTA